MVAFKLGLTCWEFDGDFDKEDAIPLDLASALIFYEFFGECGLIEGLVANLDIKFKI